MKKLFTMGMLGLMALVGCDGGPNYNAKAGTLNPDIRAENGTIPGRVVIDAMDDISDAEHQALLVKIQGQFPHINFSATDLAEQTKIMVGEVQPDQVDDVIEFIRSDSRVQHVEPSYEMKALYEPNDPMYKDQWGMKMVGTETAWNYTTGRGVVVAVIDTGIACEDRDGFHKISDLQQTKCTAGWNFVENHEHAFDDHGHGTHVAGTIAQSTNNNIGVVGIAYRATLMPVKVLSGSGSGTSEDVADGIRWAADHGAQVINLSLGGSHPARIQQDAINYARSKGTVVIAAAGNSGGPVGYPAAFDGVVAVSAIDSEGLIAKFSSRGPQVDIGAPGVAITQQTVCAEEKGKNGCEQYATWNGTSMATPHVAGAAALLVSLGVTDPDTIEQTLKENARTNKTTNGQPTLYGSGLLNVGPMVRKVVWHQALTRLVFIGGLTLLLFSTLKNRNGILPRGGVYWASAILTGVGLFFLPMLGLNIEILRSVSRPLVEMDLEFSANLHHWLPLASLVVPAAMTVLTWHLKSLRMATAGVSIGVAAYLGGALFMGGIYNPLSWMFQAWMTANAVVCYGIAHWNLMKE